MHLAALLAPLAFLSTAVGEDAILAKFPNLQNFSDLARNFPDIAIAEIKASPLRAVAPVVAMPQQTREARNSATATVVAHGMGDSCFEPGMASITKGIGQKTGGYAKCIPTGGNIITDTINGYLLNMDKSVEVFAKKIRADPNLKDGFNAIGFSQGNSLIRGYIELFNDPPVKTFISVHGTIMGVSAFPGCFRQEKPLGLVCRAVAEVCGIGAYTKLFQSILFQANYFREPSMSKNKAYLETSQIAQWNNEAKPDSTINANFAKTQRFVGVKALQDSMVYPNEGEWWGAMDDGGYKKALNMTETKFYKQDLFGLKTAYEAGKFAFESTPGDHLEFSDEQLYGWVEKYFMSKQEGSELVV